MNRICIILAASLFCISAVQGATFSYTDWTTATNGIPGSGSGVIHAPTGNVTVSYTGEVTGSVLNNSGSYQWTPASTFTSSTVSNAPPLTDIIKLGNNTPGSWSGTNKITFSTPVVNPILSVLSLGGGTDTVQWAFDANFVIVSRGSSPWGGTAATFTQPQPNVLSGHEGSGVIEFVGTYSSLSFVQSAVPNNEEWHGFTVGIQGIPEPSALSAALLLVGAGAIRRRSSRRRLD